MKSRVNSFYQRSKELFNSYNDRKAEWQSARQRNELFVDLGSKAIKNRTLGKYARRLVKSSKWEETEEYRHIESEYEAINNEVRSEIRSIYSLSRRGNRGKSDQILHAFNKRIDKVRLDTKIKHMRDFLNKFKDENLVDKESWDIKKSKNKKTKKSNAYNDFLQDIINGNFPRLTTDVIEIIKPTGETLWLEKKEKYDLTVDFNWIELSRDIMACANALTPKPIGIFVGLKDSTSTFVNANLPDEAEIRQRINSKIDPKVEFRILNIQFPNKTNGTIIVIKSTSKLHTFNKDWKINGRSIVKKGEIWIREGTRKRKLDTTEVPKYAVKKSKINN